MERRTKKERVERLKNIEEDGKTPEIIRYIAGAIREDMERTSAAEGPDLPEPKQPDPNG
jgi:hypothetical protein